MELPLTQAGSRAMVVLKGQEAIQEATLGCCAFPTLDARHIDADELGDLRVALPVP
jgi:hypothetical protein